VQGVGQRWTGVWGALSCDATEGLRRCKCTIPPLKLAEQAEYGALKAVRLSYSG
jgi:hypothetical protein